MSAVVVLAFLTHVSLELCGFVGSWHAKGNGAPTHPLTVGVKAFDPAAALGAASSATSLLDFVNRQLAYYKSTVVNIQLLPQGGEVSKQHVEKLFQVLESAQKLGYPIIPQSQTVPEQPVGSTN